MYRCFGGFSETCENLAALEVTYISTMMTAREEKCFTKLLMKWEYVKNIGGNDTRNQRHGHSVKTDFNRIRLDK